MRLAITLCLLGLSGALHAETASSEQSRAPLPALQEETLTVVGTKTQRVLNQVGATISVLNSEQIDQQIVRDIADLIRYEPGVSVSGTGSRFGLSGFNIRGIEGNRVLTIVDGVRVADEFSFGPFLSSQRDFVDVDSVEVVEIARGPVSSLYGSDALGGVVLFTTKSPQDYLGTDERYYAGIKAGYSEDDSSFAASATLAAGNESLAGLLTLTRRDANETETSGASGFTAAEREEADPQDIQTDNLTAKLSFTPTEQHALTLTYERFRQENDAQILSDYGLLLVGRGPPTLVETRDSIDEKARDKLALDYRYVPDSRLLDYVNLKLFTQESQSDQRTDERRVPISGPQTRFRESQFEQESEGVYLQFGSSFSHGDVAHILTYGLDHFVTDSESLRSGGTFDIAGNPVFEFTPFPTRDFPLSEVTQTAFFMQDEIVLLDDRLRLTPGVRFDRFRADTSVDSVYLEGNPGTPTPEDYDDSEITFSFAGVFAFNEVVSAFARYSEGFRAPPYDDVNVGFTNPLGGYKTIANPDLESETSQGVELGLRVSGAYGDLSLAVYRNDYDNFIESLAIAPAFLPTGGVDPTDGFLTFQSVNRDQVEIHGVELSGLVSLGAVNERLQGLGFRYALAYADGEDTQSDEPLDTINPLSGVLGLLYDAPSGRWGGQLVWTLVAGKEASDISLTGGRSETPGYGTLDLLAYVDVTDNVSLNIGLFNLTDKKYIRWADTISLGDDAPGRFTQPGFNAGATVRVEF